MAEFILSSKGKPLLKEKGFLFEKHKELADGSTRWRCIMARKGKCKASAKTIDEAILGALEDNIHNHAPNDSSQINKRLIYAEAKQKAIDSRTPGRSIYAQISASSSQQSVSSISSENLMRTIRKTRQKNRNEPLNPKTLNELQIPNELVTMNSGESVLLFDTGKDDESRLIIFASRESMDFLARSTEWACDGTFAIVPKLFYQLYTIHGRCGHHCSPCVFALLVDKKRETYLKFFQNLSNVHGNLSPTKIIVDFEFAAICSLRKVFPVIDAVLAGCHFHFAQALWRRIQSLGFANLYVNDESFALNCRLFIAMAFLPLDLVVPAFEQIQEDVEFPANFDLFLNYFEDTYIGRFQRRGRQSPRIAINMWNCYDRINEELPRTTNSVEGWHNSFAGSIGATHPTIWTFIEKMKEEMVLNRNRRLEYDTGSTENQQKKIS